MTKQDICGLMEQLEKVADIVRLVDGSITDQYYIDRGGELQKEPYRCYAAWGRDGRCDNCVSARALACRGRRSKFEFSGDEVYYVMGKYVEVEDKPFVLEMVYHITDEMLLGACGQNAFTETISAYNKKLYVDPLTGAYNRRYYEEQFRAMTCDGVAMLDVDDFKAINDTHGHDAGDAALRTIVETVFSCIRGSDILIRYGGDEFLLAFGRIGQQVFAQRLEEIRQAVSRAVPAGYPQIRLSVSIGGVHRRTEETDMLLRADAMLYEAKKEKNCVRLG